MRNSIMANSSCIFKLYLNIITWDSSDKKAVNSEYALNIFDSAAKDKQLNQDLRKFFIYDKL